MAHTASPKNILITGGSGFFGGILKNRLLEAGHRCVNIDLCRDDTAHPNLTSIQGDIRDRDTLERLFAAERFDAVMHCAAILAHAVKDDRFLWESNVDGTRNVADMARKHGVERVVFTSSNCLWAQNLRRPVTEDEPPNPIEIYGRSKWEGERILHEYARDLHAIIIRCPTIIDSGRLGLLAILFEFIHDGRKVWVVGGGRNRYQFIYAQDLADACIRGLVHSRSDTFNIGSDDVKPLRDVFAHVIERAGSNSVVASLPRRPTLLAMQIAHYANVSPLGPYHYKMIAEDFIFDTSKIKGGLGWRPTLTNEGMLLRAYEYYMEHRGEILSRTDVSAHRQPAKMGIIRLLKWVS
jgi:nucleoside-diphosphate-sugar epimerase